MQLIGIESRRLGPRVPLGRLLHAEQIRHGLAENVLPLGTRGHDPEGIVGVDDLQTGGDGGLEDAGDGFVGAELGELGAELRDERVRGVAADEEGVVV